MDNCWVSCQVMADMKFFYDDPIIINLYELNEEGVGQERLQNELGT